MRVAWLGIYDRATLYAFDESANVEPITKELGVVDFQRLIFEAMLQSGIDHLMMPPVPEDVEAKALALPKFLADRIQETDGFKPGLSSIALAGAFARHLPPNYLRDHKTYGPVIQLQCFLDSLFIAAHGRGAMVTISGLPSLDDLRPLLPTELFVPAANLLSALEPAEVPVAAGYSLESRMATVSQEILNSRAFDSYVSAHGTLDDPECPIPKGLTMVQKAAEKLTRKNERYLKRANLPIRFLPLVAKLANLLTGGLLTGVSDSVADLVQSSLNEKKRLLVYDLSGFKTLLFKARLEALHERLHKRPS